MSKENLFLFLHNMSYVSYIDKDLCSRININYFASHRYGNIEVKIVPFRTARGLVGQRISVHSYCGKYNQGSVLNLLRMPLRHERPDLWHRNLGVNHNLLQVLGLLPVKHGYSKRTMDEDESDQESSMEDEETLNIRADMVDESGRSPDVAPES